MGRLNVDLFLYMGRLNVDLLLIHGHLIYCNLCRLWVAKCLNVDLLV